ncbi:hypothetical protein [Geoalkalibacter halelectricus]|uniref:Uncharacterized protein n=1 Tax=Geoalkalibacter halelectricus TaxID=2847045 RepID=A0ABY5ZQX8_9BACT|nr:hypothetical protein [Geoalkalibacter halelectricus]MDO3379334.1 hypothetical protein [Geoalkalibacter halelectricus]UWZ81086.1 hypothetical protein L9S41_06740 [Geoalkalibacter halelectricus]
MSEAKKTSSRMTPEIAARYRRTLELFERSEAGKKRTYSPPMPFEVPEDAPGGGRLVELVYHEAFLTPERYYGKTIISKSRVWSFAMIMAGGMAVIFLGLGLAHLYHNSFMPIFWLFAVFLALSTLYARRKARTADRNACHIFERPTGKVYLYRCNEPHRVVNFYDLHFSTTGVTTSGLASSSRLNIDLPDPETGELDSFGGFFLPTPEESMRFWYALVRYMDRDWPFDERNQEYFHLIEMEKKKHGYRVEGVRHPDGTVEWI